MRQKNFDKCFICQNFQKNQMLHLTQYLIVNFTLVYNFKLLCGQHVKSLLQQYTLKTVQLYTNAYIILIV